MRSIVFIFLTCFFCQAAWAQLSDKKSSKALVFFRNSEVDFGKIPQHKPVTHDFWLVNHSKQPILIENVMASCGCTTPEYSKAPVQAGDSTLVRVGFNAAAAGEFNRGINIQLNNSQVEQITVSGVVYGLPSTPAPKNKIIDQIKSQN
ncbi:DUF1573 domain-containing protein [Gynurincola endophyticus]|jgi:hypothetical protein|uniref:DUF1573 domain-containing protein n=1 Tax=Gynurincola endophyticus TaxID=2479004 RepID=UPI000F8F6D41|nr:DUF1573 domain-containing protein [Gynurincola endophyticus]